MRIPEEEYNDTTLKRLIYRIDGFFEMETRRERAHWERARWQTATIRQFFAKRGQKIKMKDIAVFPWEEEQAKLPKGRKLTKEEIQEKFAKHDKRMRERWQKTG